MSETELVPAATARGDVTVIATSADEMRQAQAVLVATVDDRLAKLEEEDDDLTVAIETAKAAGMAHARIVSARSRARARAIFYGKIREALLAGYVIVPDMPVEVFAVRVDRAMPDENRDASTNGRRPSSGAQRADLTPAGNGEYVSPQAKDRLSRTEEKDSKGQPYTRAIATADSFDPVIPFPFVMAKPRILEETQRALALRIFDELAVLPAQRRNVDPMVIGRVLERRGYYVRAVNFLVCWFLDTREL